MLDTIKIGLLRLDDRKEVPGYVRNINKNDPDGPGICYFRIPLHVVFDLEGYNTYKELMKQKNLEQKTWVEDIALHVPPTPDRAISYPTPAHEWFLQTLSLLTQKYGNFPATVKTMLASSLEAYHKAQREPVQPVEEDDYEPPPMTKAQEVAAGQAFTLYNVLQRSRFDPGRPNRQGEFRIPPFYRDKADQNAKDVIKAVTTAVSNYVWSSPTVSKYSETEGVGLKIKLTSLFLQAFYQEQVMFMQAKLDNKPCAPYKEMRML
jgi:hypothetical protein